VVRRLEQLGFTVRRGDPGAGPEVEPDAGPGPADVGWIRDPLVLIAPSYGNPATRQRFHDTLDEPVVYTEDRLRSALTDAEFDALHEMHPYGSARFWGALPSHNAMIDRLRQGDVVVFTGQNRVQAIATLGYKLRNERLAALLWPPEPGSQGWVNVYTVLGFQPIADIGYPQLRGLIGSSDRDIFQSARALSPQKSTAVIDGLGLAVAVDGDLQDKRAEQALLDALAGRSQIVAAEAAHVTSTSYQLPARTVIVRRAESMLMQRYRASLGGLGEQRLRSAVGHTDLYRAVDGDIIEAKRSAEHRYVREALGQLLDYAVNTRESVGCLTALFPAAPTAADVQLLHCYGVDCLYWNGGDTFTRLRAPETMRTLMRPIWASCLESS
jgi:hypothetical protein